MRKSEESQPEPEPFRNLNNLDNTGKWTLQSIRDRYWQYAKEMGLEPGAGSDLYPGDYLAERGWICTLVMVLISRMEQGDLAAAEIGIELIEEDGGFFNGRILKKKAARALKKCRLSDEQKDRIRRRVLEMLESDFRPREFSAYASLFRFIGVGRYENRVALLDKSNPWIAWYVDSLTNPNPGRRPRVNSRSWLRRR
jgi:hypothetical protein